MYWDTNREHVIKECCLVFYCFN